MRKIPLFRAALLALALTQAMPPISIASSRFDRVPPNPRSLFPCSKNRREKFCPPKIIGKNKKHNMQRGRR